MPHTQPLVGFTRGLARGLLLKQRMTREKEELEFRKRVLKVQEQNAKLREEISQRQLQELTARIERAARQTQAGKELSGRLGGQQVPAVMAPSKRSEIGPAPSPGLEPVQQFPSTTPVPQAAIKVQQPSAVPTAARPRRSRQELLQLATLAARAGFTAMAQTLTQQAFAIPETEKPFTLKPGERRFGPQGRELARVPEEAAGFTLGPGQQRFGPGGEPIAEVPPLPQKEDRVSLALEAAKGNPEKALELLGQSEDSLSQFTVKMVQRLMEQGAIKNPAEALSLLKELRHPSDLLMLLAAQSPVFAAQLGFTPTPTLDKVRARIQAKQQKGAPMPPAAAIERPPPTTQATTPQGSALYRRLKEQVAKPGGANQAFLLARKLVEELLLREISPQEIRDSLAGETLPMKLIMEQALADAESGRTRTPAR